MLDIKMVPLALSIETMIQFGLMVNELMTNSIKYAFEHDGVISISLTKKEEGYLFVYADNGRGYDRSRTKSGFGSSLVEMVIEQLDGALTFDSLNGTRYQVLLKGLADENTDS